MKRAEFLEKAKQLAVDYWTMNLHKDTYESELNKLIDEYENSKEKIK